MITALPFDSNIFNYPVGKIVVEDKWDEQDFLKTVKDFQLVYIFSSKALDISSPSIQHVDTKVTFQKSLESIEKVNGIESYKSDEFSERLEELAYLSGTFSRFKTDTRLKNGEFQKLYKQWIIKAIESKQVLVGINMEGMITYSLEKEHAKIGLIAVSESHQGLGVGKKLVRAAEYICQLEGAQEMQIPTQESNIPACKLYESLGYHVAEKVYIYHWYKD
ncbi:GNAT family N-acetyltransferase [Algoriphagus namhaensis]|uniref:GNAT family N-acetyltransferase n=1 Tax=Algoriphagus namhaensis TaxID=915353 RepID=A0ABV8AVB6_9BACT